MNVLVDTSVWSLALGSNTDFLICATATRRDLAIFTTDGDFKHFARVLRFELHQLRS